MERDGPEPARVFGDARLTVGTVVVLRLLLCVIADEAYDDVDALGGAPVSAENLGELAFFRGFPPITWRMSVGWRRGVARAADDLVGDIEAGRLPYPRCPAEEAVLRMAIGRAEEMTTAGEEEGLAVLSGLPQSVDDYDWTAVLDVLFQDLDIELVLYGTWADGIEDPDDELNQSLGMGDYRPAAWFESFSNVPFRDDTRGYRR